MCKVMTTRTTFMTISVLASTRRSLRSHSPERQSPTAIHGEQKTKSESMLPSPVRFDMPRKSVSPPSQEALNELARPKKREASPPKREKPMA
eukprot:3364722-Rhodomonas_salina.1